MSYPMGAWIDIESSGLFLYQGEMEANNRQRERISVQLYGVITDFSYKVLYWAKTIYSIVT